jgi:hypothetical protein
MVASETRTVTEMILIRHAGKGRNKMKCVNKRFHCSECSEDFERVVLESAVTAACPNCRPFVYFLEMIGLTPKQALVLTLCVVGVGYLSSKS